MHTVCVFRENTFSRRKQSLSEKSDLSTVRVTADYQIERHSFQIPVPVLWVMTKQYLVTVLLAEVIKP